jgi:hypothetical protein
MSESAEFTKSRFLDVGRNAETLTLSFARCFNESFALNLRRSEVHRAVRLALKTMGSVSWLTQGLVMTVDTGGRATNDIAAVLIGIDQRLERIASRPLNARVVERTLGITPRERSRWTKDGRLARAGTNLIRRGQLVALSTYSVGEIARLMNEPSKIRAWREADDRGGREA